MDIFFRIFGFQKEELGRDDICHVVINRCPKKNDVVFQETRIDVVCPFASISLFDHHGY